MNPRSLVTSLSLTAAMVLGAVVIVGEEKPVTAPELLQVLEPSKLARLPDAGRGYVVTVRVPDGGSEVRTTLADCARRKPGALCTRLDGGDPGDWNRYPATQLVGVCQMVACSIFSGQNPNADEDTVLLEGATK